MVQFFTQYDVETFSGLEAINNKIKDQEYISKLLLVFSRYQRYISRIERVYQTVEVDQQMFATNIRRHGAWLLLAFCCFVKVLDLQDVLKQRSRTILRNPVKQSWRPHLKVSCCVLWINGYGDEGKKKSWKKEKRSYTKKIHDIISFFSRF